MLPAGLAGVGGNANLPRVMSPFLDRIVDDLYRSVYLDGVRNGGIAGLQCVAVARY